MPIQQYQIFTNNIINKEHEECLSLMSSTHQGKKEFAQLLMDLKKSDSISFANIQQRVFISKLDDSKVQITISNMTNQQDTKLMMFLESLKNSILSAEKVAQQALSSIIDGLKKLWSSKKNIRKVMNSIGKKEGKILRLLPNSEIIKTTTNNKGNITLDLRSQIVYSHLSQNLISLGENINFNLKGYSYIGQLHPIYFIPQNQGVIAPLQQENQIQFKCSTFHLGLPQQGFEMKQPQNNVQICGSMFDGSFHGQCRTFFAGQEIINGNYTAGQKNGQFYENGAYKNYHNGALVFYTPQVTQYQPDKSIVVNKDLSVTMSQLKNLSPGGWLNQIVVDYYIERFIQEYRPYLPKNNPGSFITQTFPLKTIVVDTRETSDIFSSEITQQNYIGYEIWNNIVQSKQIKPNDRIIFLFNVDRGHFMQAVYEQRNIIVINSLSSSSDSIIAQKLTQLLTKSNFPVNQSGNQSVTQQPNGYDCAIFTLYYAIQIIKNQDKYTKDINLQVSQKQIQEFRLQIVKELLLQNPTVLSTPK